MRGSTAGNRRVGLVRAVEPLICPEAGLSQLYSAIEIATYCAVKARIVQAWKIS